MQDYLAGDYTHIDPNRKWVISRVGYASGYGSLTYTLEFRYDVWLGSRRPSGDCHQFRGLTAAENFANSAPELTDTPDGMCLLYIIIDYVNDTFFFNF